MKVAVFSTHPYDREYLERFVEDSGQAFTFFEAALDEHTTRLCSGFEAVCVFVNDTVNRQVIEDLSRAGVKLIALRCAGYNNVDIGAAAEKNITIVRVPAYSPHAVAEHTLALILTLNRKTHKAYNRVRENNFSLERLLGFDLYQKTVGVIGTGKIGAIFCTIMMGLGCRVVAHDVNESDSLKASGVRYHTLHDLLAMSDIVSLHCPLLPSTRHLINETTLATMKKGAMLINTSRGGLIHTKDVIRALKTGQLGYLGIDVYEQEGDLFFRDLSERIIPDEDITRLMSFPNVLITAHQGFFTNEALSQIAITTIDNLSRFEKGEVLVNVVTDSK
jgi:D-lactate dehydrogenase